MSGKRGNGEGSIYPYRNGFAAYAWVTTPMGKPSRKYVYGKTRPEVHDKWLKLHTAAKAGPVATSTPTLEHFLAHWLKEEVEVNLKPLTAATYETVVRLYITPSSVPSGSRSSTSATCASGSTSSPPPASAARRARTRPGPTSGGAAARSASAAAGRWPGGRSATPGPFCAARSPTR